MQEEISFLVPPPQFAEHCEVADQSDQVGHNCGLQSTTLVRNGEPSLPVHMKALISKYIVNSIINKLIFYFLLIFAEI